MSAAATTAPKVSRDLNNDRCTVTGSDLIDRSDKERLKDHRLAFGHDENVIVNAGLFCAREQADERLI